VWGGEGVMDVGRDANKYAGPWPVVAHPPCGPWGRLAQFSRQDSTTGPMAVNAVRRWGGVLEHPAESRLWAHCHMPRPGCLPDEWGGLSMAIHQVEWGHKALKPTWLYLVGIAPTFMHPPPFPGRAPVGLVAPSSGPSSLPLISKPERRLTPPLLAAELIRMARAVRPERWRSDG